jgi:parvulin-like peptidyl-prolyl isomerase
VSLLKRQEITDKVKVSPGMVRDLYESRRSRMTVPARSRMSVIVVNRGETDEEREAKKRQAVIARGKLLAGEDFAQVAKEFSEGSKATEGGDWGWIEPANLRSELKDAVESIATGEISEIVESGDAYYIFRVEERQEAGVLPFEKVRAQLESELKQAEAERLYNEWMKRLRRKHFVHIF